MKKKLIKNLIKKIANKRPYWITQLSDEKFSAVYEQWASNKKVNQLLQYEKYGFTSEDIEFLFTDYFELHDCVDENLDIDEISEYLVEDISSEECLKRHSKYNQEYLLTNIKKVIESFNYLLHQIRVEEKIDIVLNETWGYIGKDIRDVDKDDLDLKNETLRIAKDIMDNIDEYADWDCQFFWSKLRGR